MLAYQSVPSSNRTIDINWSSTGWDLEPRLFGSLLLLAHIHSILPRGSGPRLPSKIQWLWSRRTCAKCAKVIVFKSLLEVLMSWGFWVTCLKLHGEFTIHPIPDLRSFWVCFALLTHHLWWSPCQQARIAGRTCRTDLAMASNLYLQATPWIHLNNISYNIFFIHYLIWDTSTSQRNRNLVVKKTPIHNRSSTYKP